jgi:sulfur-carrier protein
MVNKPLTVLYFSWLRERLASGHEKITLPEGVATVADLMDYLSALDAGHAQIFLNRRLVRCAVNQEFVHSSSTVYPGDEIAFFPPVTGG